MPHSQTLKYLLIAEIEDIFILQYITLTVTNSNSNYFCTFGILYNIKEKERASGPQPPDGTVLYCNARRRQETQSPVVLKQIAYRDYARARLNE